MGQSYPPVYRMFCLFLLRNIFCLFCLSVIYAHYKSDKLILRMLNLFEKINHFKYQPNFEKHDMDNTMWQYSTEYFMYTQGEMDIRSINVET